MKTVTRRKSLLLTSLIALATTALFSLHANSSPSNFRQAKVLLKEHVYYDRNTGADGTAYCGCDWKWVGESGGRTDLESCGYEIRSPQSKHMVTRAKRTEWEHILPISVPGRQFQCWQDGGRSNCQKTDPVFNSMEANMFGLTPAIGEVNADRSNFRMGMVASNDQMYGECTSKTDFKQKVFEPRDSAKGFVARTYFYYHDFYDLRMSRQQQQLFMAWDKQFPPTSWEIERNRRISKIMGHENDFVTGAQKWTLNHKNRGQGVKGLIAPAGQSTSHTSQPPQNQAATSRDMVHGNRNSKIYHLSNCPSYDAMAERNRVLFNSESEARDAGFRKARNCPD